MTDASNTSMTQSNNTDTIEGTTIERNFRTVNLRPSMDVFESDESLLIHTDMPGVQKDNLQVELDGDTLTVKGTWLEESHSSGPDSLDTEYTFKRDVRLNRPVDVDGISATLKDGLLRVSLPWTKAPEPRRISIN